MTSNAKEMACKNIEINSLKDQINSFENSVSEYLKAIRNELLKQLNNLKDTIATLEYNSYYSFGELNKITIELLKT